MLFEGKIPPLSDAQAKLVEDNWMLTMFFFNRLKRQYRYDEEIIYDWVTEAAIRTAAAFDPEKGSWTALYNWKLRSVIAHYVHWDTRRVKGIPLDDDAGPQEKTRHRSRPNHEQFGMACQELEDIGSMISLQQTMDSVKVTKGQQRYVMELVFGGDNPTQTELAERLASVINGKARDVAHREDLVAVVGE